MKRADYMRQWMLAAAAAACIVEVAVFAGVGVVAGLTLVAVVWGG